MGCSREAPPSSPPRTRRRRGSIKMAWSAPGSCRPALPAIERQCVVHEMVAPRDWRLRALSQAPVYLVPPGAEAERSLMRIFAGQATGEVADGGSVALSGRGGAV